MNVVEDWVVPLVTAAVTALGATAVSRIRLSDRLRHRAAAELDILAKLPADSPAREALASHVERQVLLMVAEEEPLTAWERMDRRWGYFFVVDALAFALLAATVPAPWRYVPLGIAFVSLLYGLSRTARVERARQDRRRWRSLDADPPVAPPPEQRSGGQVVRDLLPPHGPPQSGEQA